MKVRSLLFGMLCMLALGASLASCSDDDDDSLDDGGSKVTLPQTRVYILNEGGWGANNARLAFYAPNKDADFQKKNIWIGTVVSRSPFPELTTCYD